MRTRGLKSPRGPIPRPLLAALANKARHDGPEGKESGESCYSDDGFCWHPCSLRLVGLLLRSARTGEQRF